MILLERHKRYVRNNDEKEKKRNCKIEKILLSPTILKNQAKSIFSRYYSTPNYRLLLSLLHHLSLKDRDKRVEENRENGQEDNTSHDKRHIEYLTTIDNEIS